MDEEISGGDKGDSGDAPLIDLNEALIKKLIATGVFHPLCGDRAHGGCGPSAKGVQGGVGVWRWNGSERRAQE